MFQFRAFPSHDYFIHHVILEYCSSVLPHSDISGSSLICSSPKLFAACRVLHRLLMPRHSPCALFSLTFLEQSPAQYLVLLNYAGSTRSFSKLLFTLISIKVFHNCFLSNPYRFRYVFPLLPCFLFLYSVFKVQAETFISWWRIAGSNR